MRIMAVDYGDARTGVAISDPTGLLAGQTFVLRLYRVEQVAEELASLAAESYVEEIVLGYPKNMNDTLGPRAEKSAALGELLREKTGLPVVLWDERRTTVDAHRILTETGNRGRKRKEKVDAVAATLILEGYLTYRRSKGPAL
ncbi:putative pre-16S rRNA nuclease [bioreactor metagenome]|uniref:Putative pre-16S rRNA nuclease n=1 Tax=bioreactor metagenome TaxID=1076179 RepID=A0A644YGA2_9ZZZZ